MTQTTSRTAFIGRIVGAVLVIGALIGILFYNPPKPEIEAPDVIRPAKTLKVEPADRIAARSFSGVVKANEQVELSFRVAGPLIELPVNRGQEVDKGDLIAQIDPRDFKTAVEKVASALGKARAQLKALKAGERAEVVRMRENQLAAVQADYENAVIETKRYAQLLKDGVVSQSEFDQVKLRADTAQERVGAAEQDLKQAKEGARPEDIEAQEAFVQGLEAQKREAEHRLADTTLRAPFHGVIALQYVENLEDVSAKQPIVSVQDISEIEVVADVPESVIALVRRENVASTKVEFEAVQGRTFDVEFKEIEAVADARTQTYALTVSMPAPEDVRILPGMAATLTLALKPDAAIVVRSLPIPISAVFANAEGKPRIWKVDPKKLTVHLVPVEISQPIGDLVLVQKGLEVGDEIVTAGVHFLREGMKIRRLESTTN